MAGFRPTECIPELEPAALIRFVSADRSVRQLIDHLLCPQQDRPVGGRRDTDDHRQDGCTENAEQPVKDRPMPPRRRRLVLRRKVIQLGPLIHSSRK